MREFSKRVSFDTLDQLYHSIHMFDCFFIKNFCVDLLYDSIHMFVYQKL